MNKKTKWVGIGLGVLAVVAVIVAGVSLLWKQPAEEVSLTDAETFAPERMLIFRTQAFSAM